MLRLLVLAPALALLAACGFQGGVGPAGGDGGPRDSARDAPPTDAPIDGSIDGAIDAPIPIDACGDDDSDGVCNGVDDWPCGAKPNAPTSTVAWTTGNENVTLSLINVASMGQRIVATPGQTLAVSAGYSIIDCACPGCIDQIEIGFEPGGKQACLYNGNPQGGGACGIPTTGAVSRNVAAPTTPGVYPLRFNRGNDTSCQTNGVWWANVAPPAGNTFALVCVH